MKINNYWSAIVSTGVLLVTAVASAELPAPTLVANPQTVQIADGKTTGITTVTWNAGLAHPNAQVMLKSNNDPQFVFTSKGSNGSASVAVQPGTNLFTLIDGTGEQRLATVTVTGQTSSSAAAQDWIDQKLRERKAANKTHNANDPNRPHGFINGVQLATPTPSAQADESSSDDQHKKNKKKKKHHHHDDGDDENQGND